MSNEPLPNNLTLVAGSPYLFKVSGLGSDKRHVAVVSSSPLVTVVAVSTNDRNIEQTLRLEPAAIVWSTSQGNADGLSGQQANTKRRRHR